MDLSNERLQYRGRTAIGRSSFSRPIKLALREKIITSEKTVLDYGCGRGGDVALLESIGVESIGWDPNHRTDGKRQPSDVVNLGYVVNVIEDPSERVAVLKDAYSLARECLIVSAQTEATTPSKGIPFGDGILTSRKTFQKYFATENLRSLIEQATGARAFLVEKGIFFVFKSEEARARYALSRERVRASYRPPSKLRALDVPCEFQKQGVLLALCEHLFLGTDILNDNSVSVTICEAYFGSVGNALQVAESMLNIIGDRTTLLSLMKSASCGKMLPDSFYFHSSALPSMPIEIRLLVHCALAVISDTCDDYLIKLSKTALSVSILFYRDFATAPHPELQQSLIVDLKKKTCRKRNYLGSNNRPILHRKETFVLPTFPDYDKFQLLSRKEEELGLLNRSDIGFKLGWEAKLNQIGFDPNSYVSNLPASTDTYEPSI